MNSSGLARAKYKKYMHLDDHNLYFQHFNGIKMMMR